MIQSYSLTLEANTTNENLQLPDENYCDPNENMEFKFSLGTSLRYIRIIIPGQAI